LRPGAIADIAVFDPNRIAQHPERKCFDVPDGNDGHTWRYTREPAPFRLTMVAGVPTFHESAGQTDALRACRHQRTTGHPAPSPIGIRVLSFGTMRQAEAWTSISADGLRVSIVADRLRLQKGTDAQRRSIERPGIGGSDLGPPAGR